MTSGSLWSYYRDEIDDVDDNASDGKSSNIKHKQQEKIPQKPERPPRPPQSPPNPDGSQPPQPPQTPVPALNVEITFPLKYLLNYWRFLDLAVRNCEIELDLSWEKDCVLIELNGNITGVNFMALNFMLQLFLYR